MSELRQGVIACDGFNLQYRIEGEGRPVLVVGSALYYPRCFSGNLRRHLKLAFMDHRGFAPGNACADKTQYALPLLIDDIEHVRSELGLGQVVILGHSGHAFMALDYAKAYPQHVSHVVMLNVAPDYAPVGHAAAERYLEESVCPERKVLLAQNMAKLPAAIAAAPDKAFVTYCLLMGPKSWFDPAFDAAPLWDGVETNMAMFDHVWGEAFRDIDITKGLDALDKPVFLGLGRHDFLVPPPWLWESVRDRFRDLTIRVFERSGHAPFLEEPALFDAELLGWLAAR
ncbi:alpha/beta hydrolase [Ferrovibrio sp.]|uniref:alpha/beta fold hydrolase n=1 Tax=Ferrovibrio sp. TaxID=1917215 RepID=UPI0026206E6F|nr:alpha/beta hydrolase [Ferrovibrio sp.]